MLIAKATRDSESGAPPQPELMAAIGRFGEEMGKRGVLVDQGGLFPSSMGTRVRASGGELTVTDGPFAETKEVIAGYAIVQVASKAEAVDISKQFLKLHMDVIGPSYEAESEVRQMFEMPPQS